MTPSSERSRKPRADSVRNREILLAAAKVAFAEGGAEVALEEVARRAGVGIGTLYRHFPTRAALLAGVYGREVDQLAATATTLLTEKPPAAALEAWLHLLVDYLATKRVVVPALRAESEEGERFYESARRPIREALHRLAAAAAGSGEIRADVDADDIFRMVVGFSHGYEQPGWQASARRLIGILMAGLRAPPVP